MNFPSSLIASAVLHFIKIEPLGARELLYFYLVCSSSWLCKLSIISMFIRDECDKIVGGFNSSPPNDFAGKKAHKGALINNTSGIHTT